jgi:hypothetical protein
MLALDYLQMNQVIGLESFSNQVPLQLFLGDALLKPDAMSNYMAVSASITFSFSLFSGPGWNLF